MAVQADGKILLCGRFTTLGGQPRNGIGRLNRDGTLDTGFNPGAGGDYRFSVYCLAVQADGKILVGGSFTTLGGQTRERIARLNVDGTPDTDFNPGANGSVYSLAVQADGKILAGGNFTTLGGQTRGRIGRLNPDGTLDEGFNPGANDNVHALAMQTDGKILVGGSFTTLGGQTRGRIGRLNPDGTLDEGFNPGTNDTVYALALQTDGKVVVGGHLGGQTREPIGRLNSDGSLDTGFNPGPAWGYDLSSYVSCLALQTDGKILVGGSFTWLSGQPRECIGRLNPDGTLDTGFNPGANGEVQCLALQADGKLLVGGRFDMLGGQSRTSIGLLNATAPAKHSLTYDGSTITWSRSGTSPEVWCTVFDWSSDGLLWTPVGEGALIPGGWTLTNVIVPPQATLRARGFVREDKSGWFVEDYWGPLVWIAQPVSRTNDAGSFASFEGLVGGTAPAYQWFKDGMAVTDGAHISGATREWLALTDVLGTDAGGYHVVISNAFGVRTSVVATLTVNDPVIAVPPVSQTREPGENVTLSVTARGTAPLEYQWWKDGVALSGQTKPLMTFPDLRFADAGAYCVVVSSPYGSVTSSVASLRVNMLDTGFNPRVNFSVSSLAVQVDGKVLLDGSFSDFMMEPCYFFRRLNLDGTLDTGFNPGVDGSVSSLAVQADGRILVGGGFTTLGGQPRERLGRLNPDGTLDPGFNLGASGGYRMSVSSLVAQADGKILVGGRFATLGGQPRNCIGRLNPDSTLDPGFNPGAGGDYEPSVSSLAVQADGKILVGGSFTTLGGQPRNCIGRLNPDGTLDAGFNPGADGLVSSLVVQADGRILVGGHFTTLGGQTRRYIGRLNPDGTLDTGFNPGANNDVYSLGLQADGKILVAGGFTTLGGQSRERIGRLNPDGTLDTVFNPGADGSVSSLVVQADGKILVGGGFGTLDGQLRSRVGRLNATDPATQSLSYDGSIITWLRGGTSPEVWSTTFDCSTNGGDWMVLGMGTRIPGGWQLAGMSLPANSTLRARGHTAGGQYSGYNGSSWIAESLLFIGDPVITSAPVSQNRESGENITLSVTAQGTAPLSYQWLKDGVVLTGQTRPSLALTNLGVTDAGAYRVVVTSLHGCATSSVASLTLNRVILESGFDPGANGAVLSLAAQADGRILVGGDFTTLGGQTRRYIGRLNPDGSVETGFNPGANGSVSSLAVQADGKILVGGDFNVVGQLVRNHIARLNPDGTLDTGFNPGAGFHVYSLAVQTDGKILVGGDFTALAGQTRNCVGRVNADGTLDNGFRPDANGSVLSLALQTDGKILVSGNFTMLGGQARDRIGRLNPDGTLDADFNPGAGGANDPPRVSSVALQWDGKILVGGNFTRLGGQTRNYLGRLNPDGSLDTGFNPGANGSVDSIILQADGRILIGGTFDMLGGVARHRVARLNPDGTVDTGFNPGAGGSVSSLAVQADGKVLVGGAFTTLGGQARNYIGRLDATDPATGSLAYEDSNITWLRGGTSPEVWRTTFDYSTNGVDWTSLGMGTRIAGGWQLTGVSLATNSIVRARGHTTGGYGNSSSWFVESLLSIGAPTVAPMLSVESMKGPSLCFKLTGGTNAQYAVETATNSPLAEESWQPVITLTLTNGWGLFDWTNVGESGRFFRAK
jgi:uncharacterized delta-60 repeat protein